MQTYVYSGPSTDMKPQIALWKFNKSDAVSVSEKKFQNKIMTEASWDTKTDHICFNSLGMLILYLFYQMSQ